MNNNLDTIDKFLTDAKNLSQGTVYVYNYELKLFIDFINKPIKDINTSDIRKWLASLYDANYKPITIKNKITSLYSFFKYCKEEGIISKDPTENIDYPKLEEKPPYYLKREQMDKLREIVKDNNKYSAIVETLYSTGVRISELIDINKSDINWEERVIKVMGKGEKERLVLFSYICKVKLQNYLYTRNDTSPYLFINSKNNKKMCRRWVDKQFEGFGKQLSIKLTPHTLRHTFAAHLAEKGMPLTCIQDLLGHERFDTTRIYSRLYTQARKAIYDRFY